MTFEHNAQTWPDWHQALRDGKEWAWGPTQVMWRLDAVVAMVEAARDRRRSRASA